MSYTGYIGYGDVYKTICIYIILHDHTTAR